MVNEMVSEGTMRALRPALVDTELGALGLDWNDNGLTRLQLPARTPEATLAAMRHQRIADAPTGAPRASDGHVPAFVTQAMATLVDYAKGAKVDFAAFPVDLEGIDPFRRAIYEAARALGYGQTMTYGQLAEAAGYPGMAREAGVALGRNPVAIIVPCHRITAAGGRLGGFSAPGGALAKQRLLTLERAAPHAPWMAQGSFAF